MSVGKKNKGAGVAAGAPNKNTEEIKTVKQIRAEHLGQESSWVMMIPAVVFSAIVILLVRCKYYSMPMSQFSWTSWTDDEQLSDFFTKQKMEVIVACGILAVFMLLYKFTVAELAFKRTWLYIPIGVYSAFVLLSYICSDYKEFALWGWTERFEGTITILCYMVMLVFIINVVNGEKNIRSILAAVGISSFGLCLLGVTQLLDKDFFKTATGQKLIVANDLLTNGYKYWELIDKNAAEGVQTLQFNMAPGTIYQTVFNINYVSFYLALLIPIFTMLFLRAMNKESGEPIWKKIALAVLLGLLVVNDLGSRSSGGYVGLIAGVIVAIVVLNKRLVKMLKPLLIVIVLFGLLLAKTSDRWKPELTSALQGLKENTSTLNPVQMDYIENDGLDINLSLNGEPLRVGLAVENDQIMGLYVYDKDENFLELIPGEGDNAQTYSFTDPRFADIITLKYGSDSNGYLELDLIVSGGTTQTYRFLFGGDTFYYVTAFGRVTQLEKVDVSKLFADNPRFGSWRGYIWSRSIPLLKKYFFVGAGADTYCIVFPQNDVAGRFSTYAMLDSTIVDKPHNMFLGMGINTGCISLLAMLTLFGGYILQTLKLLWKRDYGTDYLSYVAAGILFGVIGFLVAGLANDSSVSTMPMFYTMLGIGISINMMLKKKDAEAAK